MIYTVTLNPSIDYVVQVKDMQLGQLNKMDHDLKFPGGKGINVSRILHELNIDTTALGFLGGFTGEFIADWLARDGVSAEFVAISDDTRINIKLKSDSETEINGRGPAITEQESAKLLKHLEVISNQDTVILSGSKPPSLPDDFYMQMIEKIKVSNSSFVIDTTGKELMDSLSFQPLLVKPNKEELAELFGVDFQAQDEIIPYGKKLLELGAKHVIISMAGEGALLFTEAGVYKGINPNGKVKNSVGAGDSMIAGFVGKYSETKDPVAAFKMGIASGSATAFSNDLATKQEIHSLLNQVEVQQL